jgi:hypothetical protein
MREAGLGLYEQKPSGVRMGQALLHGLGARSVFGVDVLGQSLKALPGYFGVLA